MPIVSPLNTEIGKRLRTLRGSLSQKEFAKKVNISFRTYQRYELGERIPPSSALSEIADYCNTTVDWILTGRGSRLKIYNDILTDMPFSKPKEYGRKYHEAINKIWRIMEYGSPEANQLLDQFLDTLDPGEKKE